MICFDLDGTLLDTINDMGYSMNRVLERYNLKTNSKEDYISYIGNGVKKLVERSIHGKMEYFDRVYNEYQDEYKKNQTNKTTPFVDINTLIKLKEKHKLSVISNKADSDVKRIINFYFKDIFDYVAGNEENVLHKPNREPFDLMFDRLNLNEEVIYVGDSIVDYEFAKNCNIKFIGVSYGYGNLDNLDVLIIDDIKELLYEN